MIMIVPENMYRALSVYLGTLPAFSHLVKATTPWSGHYFNPALYSFGKVSQRSEVISCVSHSKEGDNWEARCFLKPEPSPLPAVLCCEVKQASFICWIDEKRNRAMYIKYRQLKMGSWVKPGVFIHPYLNSEHQKIPLSAGHWDSLYLTSSGAPPLYQTKHGEPKYGGKTL